MVTENEIEAHLIHERLASDNVYIRPETLERSVLIIETKMHDLYLYIFMDINLQTVFYFYKKNLIIMYCYLFLELFIHHLEKLCIMTSRTSYLDLPQQGMCDWQQHFKSVCLLKSIVLSMH